MIYSSPTITPFNSSKLNNLLPNGADNLVHPFPRTPLLFPLLLTSTSTSTSTTSESLNPLSNFTLFPHLPLELRLLIIKHTLPLNTSRVVLAHPYAISSQTRLNTPPPLSYTKSEYLFRSPSLPPVALWVNQEFRGEALRFYRPCFGFDHVKLGGVIYFNSPSQAHMENGNGIEKVLESESNESKGKGKGKEIEINNPTQSSQSTSNETTEAGGRGDILYFEFTGQPFYSNLFYFTATIPGSGCSRLDLELVTRVALSHRIVLGRPHKWNKLVRGLQVFPNLKEMIVAVERGVNLSVGSGVAAGERFVAREARLTRLLPPTSAWDIETQNLVKEINDAHIMWGFLGWRNVSATETGYPKLTFMEVVNLEERECGKVVGGDEEASALEGEDGKGEGKGKEKEKEKGRKSGMAQLGDMWRRLHVGGRKSS